MVQGHKITVKRYFLLNCFHRSKGFGMKVIPQNLEFLQVLDQPAFLGGRGAPLARPGLSVEGLAPPLSPLSSCLHVETDSAHHKSFKASFR